MNIFVSGNLVLEVIEDCNLKCDMCMRGESTHKRITKTVVNEIFKNIKYIDTLILTGGEVTLAYDEINMIINTIKKNKVTVDNCLIVVNGTIYNKKLFDLLRKSFKKFEIAISTDYFHDKSIKEIYKDNIDIAYENMYKISREKGFTTFYGLSKYIIDCGRAVDLKNVRKEKQGIIPFVSTVKNNKYLYVGPEISIDVFGNLTNGSTTYKKDINNTLGNIFDKNLAELIKEKSIINNFNNIRIFNKISRLLEQDYFNGTGNYVISNGEIIPHERTITNKNYDSEIYDSEKCLIFKYIERNKK